MTAEPTLNWVLWTGSLGFDCPIADRFRIAQAGGYRRITISPSDVARERAEAGDAHRIAALAAATGIEVMMDPVVNWHPASQAGPFRAAAFTLDDMLGMCQESGASAMTAVALVDSLVPEAELPEHFGRLCDRAAEWGIEVALEFIPMTAIKDLRSAWAIVAAADRPNGGLLFDTWHFFRGRPDLDLLGRIPGERIFAVQLNDAQPEPGSDPWHDTLHRELPGAGDFNLRSVLETLLRTGGLRRVGAEVMHPEQAALTPFEAAHRANEPARVLLADVLEAAAESPQTSPVEAPRGSVR